ncbi:MAG: ABC transporter ATP-binding protein [Ilumatobacteraceae bacterium]|jgi:peptide/nickel transport system ATP-binding protein|nr:ABC transporter ATP-binding protein [Ilumatobacteraceae bacterium]
MSPILSTRDLRVSFPTPAGTVLAVRGVNLDVERGEVVGIVGESGSGKSVSFLSIMGLLPSSAVITGSAVLDGTELIGASDKTIRSVRGKRMAMIFQDPLSALNPVHRIGDQIVEMILAHQTMPKQQAHDRAVELLDLVGLPQPALRAKQYPHEFSGGMRQRVMIAMAIANEPDVLVADEPTTALDVTVQAQILDVLMEVKSRLNTAVVFITHDLGVIARIADRVEVMYAGMTVERAQVNDMFETPGHPYTRGLMASLPQAGRQRLEPIVGSPPNMIAPPSGCAFRPRCSEATDECSSAPMELVQVGRTETACIRAQHEGAAT